MLYFALVGSKLEYASVALNSVTITDSNKLEPIHTIDFFSGCGISLWQYIGKIKFSDTAYQTSLL
jgi:hypothetical protein